MKLAVLRRILWMMVLGLFCGCSKVPSIPDLKEKKGATYAVGDSLSLHDVREIFAAINKNGQLDGLKPFFASNSLNAQKKLTKLVDQYVFQEKKLTSLIDKRINRSGFSEFQSYVAHLALQKNFPLLTQGAFQLMNHSYFPRLVSRDISFFQPEMAKLVGKLQIDQSYRESHTWDAFPEPTGQEFFQDLKKLILNEKTSAELVALSHLLDKKNFGKKLLNALRGINSSYSHPVQGPVAYEAFSYGLRKMILSEPDNFDAQKKNNLALLLELERQADQGTNGLMKTMADTLYEKPELLSLLLGKFTDPLIIEAIHSKIVSGFTSLSPWSELLPFKKANAPKLTLNIYQGILKVRGDQSQVGDPFHHTLRSKLPAYALSVWFSDVLKANEQALLAATDPWQTNIKPVSTSIELMAVDSAGNTTFPHRARMKAFGLDQKTITAIETYLSDGLLPNFSYQLNTPQITLAEALYEAVETAHRTLPLGDVHTFIHALTIYVSRPQTGMVESLEVANILNSVNRFFSVVAPETTRTLIQKLVVETEIGLSEWEGEGGLLEVFGPLLQQNPKHLKLVRGLTQNVQSLVEFDTAPAKGLPSPFESYIALLRSVPPNDIDVVGQLFGFLAKSNFFDFDPSTDKASYPALSKLIVEAETLSKTFHRLSLLTDTTTFFKGSEQEIFLNALETAFGSFDDLDPISGTQLHLNVFGKLIEVAPKESHAWIETLWQQPLTWLSNLEGFPADERQWTIDFVEAKSHLLLWEYWQESVSKKEFEQLIETLLVLEQSGTLENSFEALQLLDNGRLFEVADTLLRWQRSGELKAFLLGLQTLVDNP